MRRWKENISRLSQNLVCKLYVLLDDVNEVLIENDTQINHSWKIVNDIESNCQLNSTFRHVLLVTGNQRWLD